MSATVQTLADNDTTTDYALVRNTLEFITENWREQPSLEVIAGEAGLSPGHLQRVFKRWAGISP
ncbi:MAG: 6-O-methylguanine DNA methyltransferase, partial [Aestuariivirgaceae bacterium]